MVLPATSERFSSSVDVSVELHGVRLHSTDLARILSPLAQYRRVLRRIHGRCMYWEYTCTASLVEMILAVSYPNNRASYRIADE